MVRDWCQYKGEGFFEDEDEGGEDLLSLLLLFNLDHCVDPYNTNAVVPVGDDLSSASDSDKSRSF